MNMSSYNKKIVKVQWICIIGILLVHTYNLVYYNISNSAQTFSGELLYTIETLGSQEFGNNIAVPIFMFISGFLFYKNCEVYDIKGKIIKRIRTLVIPYLIWNTIGTVYYLFIARIPVVSAAMNGAADDISINNILLGVFLHKYYYPFWFLLRLIVFTALAPILYKVLRCKWGCLTATVSLALLVIFFPEIDQYTTKSLLFYMLGGIAATYFYEMFERQEKSSKAWLYGFLLLICIGIKLLACQGMLRQTINLILPALFWMSLNIVDFHDVTIHNYERRSFYIYCAHVLPLEVVEKIFAKLFGTSIVGAYFDYFFAPVITLIILMILFGFLRKCCPTILSTMCGGRIK